MATQCKKYYNVCGKERIKSNSFITVPNSLICYNRDTLFSTWQIIERQLEQLNPKTDNEIYTALDALAWFIFNL
jgi:hypothetical protein